MSDVQVFEGDGKMNPEWQALVDNITLLKIQNKDLKRVNADLHSELARVREEARKRITALKEGKSDKDIEEIPELPSYGGTATNYYGPITIT